MSRIYAAMLLTWCIASCDSNDPSPQALVTFTLEIDHEAWLFASDADGKVLDSKQLVFNEPITLSTPDPPETFSLTFVRRLTPRYAALDVTTYTGLTPGGVFTPKVYEDNDSDHLTSLGKYTVKVNNYPQGQTLPLIVSDLWRSVTYFSTGQSSPTFAMDAWDMQQSELLFSGYQDDLMHPVYKRESPVDVGATVDADFTTFTPYEKTFDLKGFDTPVAVKVSFQLYSYSADAPSSGYKLANVEWNYEGASPSVKVGYLDDLAGYYISLSAFEYEPQSRVLKKSLNYFRFGAINTSLKFLDDDLTVSNATINAFAFDFTGEYHMRAHRFSYLTNDSDISWAIYSEPGSTSLITELPPDLLAKYPDLELRNMLYASSAFYTYDDGFDYQKVLEERLTTSFGPMHQCYIQTFPAQ